MTKPFLWEASIHGGEPTASLRRRSSFVSSKCTIIGEAWRRNRDASTVGPTLRSSFPNVVFLARDKTHKV